MQPRLRPVDPRECERILGGAVVERLAEEGRRLAELGGVDQRVREQDGEPELLARVGVLAGQVEIAPEERDRRLHLADAGVGAAERVGGRRIERQRGIDLDRALEMVDGSLGVVAEERRLALAAPRLARRLWRRADRER